jgi:hypothetical protein
MKSRLTKMGQYTLIPGLMSLIMLIFIYTGIAISGFFVSLKGVCIIGSKIH